MKWDLLPHAESDYIFAIIGEELGFLGCLVVVALYGVLAYAGFRIARRSTDRFIQLASVAITVWLIGQATMNMGYVVGLLPVTGVQLPLISAGGTSLVLTLFIVGLLARFARAEPAAIEDLRSRERGRLGRWLLPGPSAAVEPVAGRTVRFRRPHRARHRARRSSPPARFAGRPVSRPMTGRRPLCIVLAGGGTGGHIEPMLALADALRRRAERDGRELRITCLGTARGMETRLVPARGYDLRLIPPVPLPRRLTVDLLRVPGRVRRAVGETRALLTELGADVVVGFGGYVALPAYLAARARARAGRRPRAERAAGPGQPDRRADRGTGRVTMPGTQLPKAEHVGMPLRRELTSLDRAALRQEARGDFGLDADRPTLLVVGGSQGPPRSTARSPAPPTRSPPRASRCCWRGGRRTPTSRFRSAPRAARRSSSWTIWSAWTSPTPPPTWCSAGRAR